MRPSSALFAAAAGLCAINAVARAGEIDEIAAIQGAIAGEVTEASVILQARLTALQAGPDGDVPGRAGVGRFHILAVNNPAAAITTPWRDAQPEGDFIIKAAVAGLAPNTRYEYRFEFGRAPDRTTLSPSQTFRTLAGADMARPVRFVIVSCPNYSKFRSDYTGPDKALGYPALEAIVHRAPQFVVLTGDNVYYDKPPIATTLDAMRKKWHEEYVHRRWVELFAVTPTYWAKDDHDHRYNDCDTTGNRAPSSALGIATFREQVPIVDPGDADAVTYRTHRVSRDLQMWIVEGRDYRSPNRAPDGPEKSLWGLAQRDWLMRKLEQSDAAFKLLISPTPLIGPDDAYKKDNHTNHGGFRHEGEGFLAWALDAGLAGQLFIFCGDRHWQYHSIHPAGFDEFACGPLNDENARRGRRPGDPASTDPDGLIDQPFTYDQPSGGFLEVELTPAAPGKRAVLAVRFFDDEGALQYEITRPASEQGNDDIDEHEEQDHHDRHADDDLG